MRLALLAFALVAALPSQAQVRQGLSEVGGSASLYSYDGPVDRVTVLSLEPSYGYFFTDRLEAGAAVSYIRLGSGGDSGNLVVFSEYHFGAPGATTVPFLGVRLGTSFTDESDIVFGGNGGAKFFFLPGGAITGELVLLTNGDALNVGAQAGVSIFF